MRNYRYIAGAGFTVVELLIVIVVIGILATLSIISYSGVSQQAQNNAVISNASSIIKLINAYIAKNGTYPSTGYELCLTRDNYCSTNVNAPAVTNNASLMTALGMVAQPPLSTPDNKEPGRYGVVYYYYADGTWSGNPQPLFVYFALKGNAQDCKLPNLSGDVRISHAGNPTAQYAWTSATHTGCYVHIDGPAA